jgi:hypothetical protein
VKPTGTNPVGPQVNWKRRGIDASAFRVLRQGCPPEKLHPQASITNYGVAIAYSFGIFERVLSPFPAALDVYCRIRTENSMETPRKP